MHAVWRLQLLGALRAVAVPAGGVEREAVSRFRTHKTAALLAFLAYHGSTRHCRDALCGILWPEDEPEAARSSLRTALASLRRQLEPPGIPSGSVILADRGGVELNPAAVTTDVRLYRQALKSAARAAHPRERYFRLKEAASLYAGELLPGFYEDWILQERQQLRDDYVAALVTLSGLAENLLEPESAMEHLRRAVAVEPTREPLQRKLIELLIRSGEPQEALRQFRQLEQVLHRELETRPSPATRALVSKFMAGPLPVGAPGARPNPVPQSGGSGAKRKAVIVPHGTATFLLADVESPSEISEVVALSRRPEWVRLLRETCAYHGGQELPESGDVFAARFPRAGHALACAVHCQRQMARWQEQANGNTSGPCAQEGNLRFAIHTEDAPRPDGPTRLGVPTLSRREGPLDLTFRILMAGRGGQILCSEETAALLRRRLNESVRLTRLGQYRLRDAARPEPLFQVEHPEMPRREFPPLLAASGYVGSHPLQMTRCTGRDAELAQLSEAVLSEEVRAVVVTGPPGVGKTRFALECASRLTALYFGEVWYVSLADVTLPEHIPEAIGRALHRPGGAGGDAIDQLAERFTDQAGLLLLDHVGHVGMQLGPLLEQLLARAPLLTCVVVANGRLPLPGARELAMAPFPAPDPELPLDQLRLSPGIELFVTRAQAVLPDFQLTVRNGAAVAELCSRLQGLPRAIDQAAAQIQTMTPQQMVRELDRPQDFLIVPHREGAGDADLRESLCRIYGELPAELRQLLVVISVLQDGWSLEVPPCIMGEASILHLVAELREHSPIHNTAAAGEWCFRLLNLVRQYMREPASPSELAAMQRRHALFLLRLGEVCSDALMDRAAHPARSVWHLRSLEAAVDWAKGAGENVVCARLALLLGRYYRRVGRDQEAEPYLAMGLEVLREWMDGPAHRPDTVGMIHLGN